MLYTFPLLVFISCLKTVTLEFDEFHHNPVVNCLLVPDSVIKVHLSLSAPADGDELFPDLSGAKVEISDGKKALELIHTGSGYYQTPELPQPGKAYSLKVTLDNNVLLKSETKIPVKPDIKITSLPDRNLAKVTISDKPEEQNFYWVGIKIFIKNSESYQYETYFFTNLLLFDDFNRTQGNGIIEGIRYSYHFYARLEDQSFNGEEISFYTPRKWPEPDDNIDYVFILYIINADEHLDKYMKSAILQYELGVVGDMPVFHTPISIYSNIENGKGIFGSYTLSEFDISRP